MGLATDILLLLLGWLTGTLLVAGWGLGFCRLLGLVTLDGVADGGKAPPVAASGGAATGGAKAGDARGFKGGLEPSGLGIAGWWIGFAPLLLFLQLWHLVLPIGLLTWAVAAAVAVAGAAAGRETLVGWGRRVGLRPWLPVSVVLVAVALAAWIASGGGGGGGRGVAVAWAPLAQLARQWALPVGIANLSPALGLNHGWTLVEALFSVGPWAGHPGRVASGLVALPLAAAALAGFGGLVSAGRRGGGGADAGAGAGADASRGLRVAAGYQAGGAVLLAGWAVAGEAGGPSPAVAAGALLFVGCGELLRGASAGLSPHRGERIDRLTLAALLPVAAAAAHPPLAVAALPLTLRAAWSLLVTDRALLTARRSTRSIGIDHDLLPGAAARRTAVVGAGVTALALAAVWLLRGFVATGRPAFPYDQTALPVAWAVRGKAAGALGKLLDAAPPLEGVLQAGAPALLPAVLGALAWLLWLTLGGAEGRHRRVALLPLVLALGLSGLLFFPVAGSSASGAAAVGAAVAASGLAVACLGRGGGPRAARPGSPRKPGEADHPWALAGCLLAVAGAVAAGGAFVSYATEDAGGAGGEVVEAGPPAAVPPLEGWSSAWGARVAVPAGDEEAAIRAGLPGWASMPAAARTPPDALREREQGEPSAGYVLDRRDPRSVIW